jgi:aspartate carbamoyltransferase regulatory subunit
LRISPTQARKEKAERIKSFGEPIELAGKALAIEIYEDVAWIAENTTVVRKLDLEVSMMGFGSIVCPRAKCVTVRKDIAFVQRPHGASNEPRLLCEGSRTTCSFDNWFMG